MELKKTVAKDGSVAWQRQGKGPLEIERIKLLMDLPESGTKSLPTEDKRIWFYLRVDKDRRAAGRGNDIFSAEPIIIVVERENFLRDSFEQFRTTTDLDLRREVKIHFLNEVSQDAGGLIREWFSIVTEDLFDPRFGLFKRAGTSDLSYVFNEYSDQFLPNHLDYLFFCGQIVAKALYEAIPIKAYLSKAIVKQLLGLPLVPDDLKYVDLEIWNSMEFLRENAITAESAIGNFTVAKKDPTTEHETTVELKKGGENILITEENKAEFIELYFQHIVVSSTDAQFKAFQRGFNSLIKPSMISMMDVDELELFLCGEVVIDVKDWKANTIYKGEYNEGHPVIQNFWTMVEKMSGEERERLLRFCTGSRRAPAEGFRGLKAANGKVSKFCIEPRTAGEKGGAFLVAHTCFNKIELPMYTSLAMMEATVKKLLDAPSSFQFSFE